MSSPNTIMIEDKYMVPFFVKQRVSIERGEGVYVWDEEGNKYLDFTAGWGVTCLGHAHPVILEALLVSKRVAEKIEIGDHGGTYSGNPLGCAVASAVIKYLIENRISENVEKVGELALKHLFGLKDKYPDRIAGIRGKGLLLLVDFHNETSATEVKDQCLSKGLFITQTNGTGIRIFPALNIKEQELEEGLTVLEQVVREIVTPSLS